MRSGLCSHRQRCCWIAAPTRRRCRRTPSSRAARRQAVCSCVRQSADSRWSMLLHTPAAVPLHRTADLQTPMMRSHMNPCIRSSSRPGTKRVLPVSRGLWDMGSKSRVPIDQRASWYHRVSTSAPKSVLMILCSGQSENLHFGIQQKLDSDISATAR
eukprot:1318607-Rhodomonas_salina.1